MLPDSVQYARALRPPYHLLSFLRVKAHSTKGMSCTDKNTMVSKHLSRSDRTYCYSCLGVCCPQGRHQCAFTQDGFPCEYWRFVLYPAQELLQPHQQNRHRYGAVPDPVPVRRAHHANRHPGLGIELDLDKAGSLFDLDGLE